MNKLFLSGVVLVFLILSSLGSFAVLSYGQDLTSGANPTLTETPSITAVNTPVAQNVPNETIVGIVLKNSDGNLVIQTVDKGIKSLNIPQNVKVTRDSIGSSVNNIQPNDQVNVTTDNSGSILSVDATSNTLISIQRFLLPILALLLILLGLILTSVKRRQQGLIKTKTFNYKH
jgi:hypothetical protein